MSRTFVGRLRGLSMIEILVTLVIVAFGVLGLLGLQARALSFQKDSFDRRNSAEMVTQLAERVRANHLGFTSGNYGFNFSTATNTPAAISTCAAAACTIAEVAARDLDQWAVELRRRMPGSAAYLEWNAADPRSLLVTIAWVEPTQSAASAVATGADPVCDDLNARLAAGLSAQYRCYRTSIFP